LIWGAIALADNALFLNVRRIVLLQRVLWFEPFWVLLLGVPLTLPGRFAPTAWHPIWVAVLLAGWPLRWLAMYKVGGGEQDIFPPLQSPLSLPVLFLMLWLPANLWASVDREISWISIGYLVWGVALFVAFINWPPTCKRPFWLGVAVAGVGVGLALCGPFLVTAEADTAGWFVFLQQRMAPLGGRLGETINPNILAGGLVVVIPLLVALALPAQASIAAEPGAGKDVAWFRPLGFGALALVVFIVILGTASRGALLAALVAGALVLALRWPRLLWALPALLVAVGAGLAWVGPWTALDQIGSSGIIGGWDERLGVWARAVYAIQDFSLTGAGIGVFNRVIPLLYPYIEIPFGVEVPHAHNLLLQVAVDLGLPGLIAYLAIHLNLIVMVATVLRQANAGANRILAIGAAGAVTAIMVHGLLDAPLWGTKLAFLPWLVFALAVVVHRQVVEEGLHCLKLAGLPSIPSYKDE
jgi:putative inorganic carbon (HCO3(-)) transporter